MAWRVFLRGLMIAVAGCGTTFGAETEQPAPYMNEAEAVAAGERLGIGSARLLGPEAVEVYTRHSWTLVYTAGKAGIRPGGGIRVGLRHLLTWEPIQTEDPKAGGYFSAEADGGVPVQVRTAGGREFFSRHFAWQTMQEVILPERGLAPGQSLRLTYGDTSGGGPGVRVQPVDESRFLFKVYVDASGNDDWLPLEKSPAIRITAAEPYRLRVVMPSGAVALLPTWCIVRAEDRYGNPATSYRGKVKFSSAADVLLPVEQEFFEADRGVLRSTTITFATPGDYTITADDGRLRATSNPVRVSRRQPERLLLWGDLHGHTLFSDGRGTVEEYYDFARRVVGLDFCAVSDHGFELTAGMWEHSKAVTNRCYEPGRFVTFNAYEWSGNTPQGGDHNVYFLEDDPPIFRSDNYYDPRNLQMYHGAEPKLHHVSELFERLAARPGDKAQAGSAAPDSQLPTPNCFCIPHYGGRHGNPAWHDPSVQRLIEIFSEHRRSEDWASTFLAAGHRLGIMASTDNHFGNPGYGYLRPTGDWDTQEIGMALIAVYAPERTREAIFRALYDRRVYATSGERILLDFEADGHPMGCEYRSDRPPTLRIEAVGTNAIARVEIKKNGREAHAVEPGEAAVRCEWTDPDFQAGEACYYYVRIVQQDGEEAISSPVWVN